MTRHWIAADYPSKRGLSRSDAMRVLSNGPDPKWFEPWASHGVLLPGVAERNSRYGYVHIVGGTEGPYQYDVHLFGDREGLSWSLEHLHEDHPRCGDECHGLFYFTADEPIRLRLVVEADEEDGEVTS
ncbi:hypothetical protein [Cryobacterium sp. CG_9.6]|uniref:hypothetical protein n=1 Tax=Cryobacterium sp. CG_9.6 TaxID=2760710 RepID=UPI00247426AB|nr:hypothetical protein [Cryobacterium sp. CG_9.6]MDH6236232.1 hypothetical protein [Cryobacterium sp. CG_9.6]